MVEATWQSLLWPGLLTALFAAVLALVTVRFVVPILPEPPSDPDDPFVKPLYRDLARPGVVLPALGAGFLAGLVASLAGPLIIAAVILAGVGAAMASVDAATTYLPFPLHAGCVLAMLVGAALGIWWWAPNLWERMLLGALFGAIAAFALFWMIWVIGQGLGWGDVRLATVVGGFCGALGVEAWWHSMLAATVLGAIVGLVIAWWRRSHPSTLGTAFPYGPSLWAGPFLGLLIAQLA